MAATAGMDLSLRHDLESTTTMIMPRVVTALSCILQRVSESNDLSFRVDAQKISAFHGLTKPSISVRSYLERIFQYANCSPSCYIVSYIYLDRFTQCQPLMPINSFNVHRLLITSVLVSAKFMDDMCYNNAFYAKLGGVSTEEMNLLELDFLFGLGFDLNVTPSTFSAYCSYIQSEALKQYPIISSEPSLAAGRRRQLMMMMMTTTTMGGQHPAWCFGEDHESSPSSPSSSAQYPRELAV